MHARLLLRLGSSGKISGTLYEKRYLLMISNDFRVYQAPLIAFEFRHVLDSMLAIAALYASRQPPMQWIPLDGRSTYNLISEPHSWLMLI